MTIQAVSGTIRENLRAQIAMKFKQCDGNYRCIDMTVDTGFTGFVGLPSWELKELETSEWDTNHIKLFDGRKVCVRTCEVTMKLQGFAHPVAVYESNIGPVIGMRMLIGSRTTVEAQSDEFGRAYGNVTIEPLESDHAA